MLAWEEYYSTVLGPTPKKSPNLSRAVARWAYLYKYAASHASYIYQLVSKSAELIDLLQSGSRPNITCVGSGAGSDFLGIIKYILKSASSSDPQFLLLDRYDWGETRLSWRTLCPKGIAFTPHFRQIDISEESDWACWQEQLQNTDLFVMSYVLSELHCIKNKATPFLEWLFRNARSNTLFLFLDNGSCGAYWWFDNLANSNNVRPISRSYQDRDELGILIAGQLGMDGDDNKTKSSLLKPYLSIVKNVFSDLRLDMRWPKEESIVAYRISIKR